MAVEGERRYSPGRELEIYEFALKVIRKNVACLDAVGLKFAYNIALNLGDIVFWRRISLFLGHLAVLSYNRLEPFS